MPDLPRDIERDLLYKIDHWHALWQRNVKLPISEEEAALIRLYMRPFTDEVAPQIRDA